MARQQIKIIWRSQKHAYRSISSGYYGSCSLQVWLGGFLDHIFKYWELAEWNPPPLLCQVSEERSTPPNHLDYSCNTPSPLSALPEKSPTLSFILTHVHGSSSCLIQQFNYIANQQLHSYLSKQFLSCPRLKRKVGNGELRGMGSQSFPVARHDVHNNYFSSNLGIACGPRQYPRRLSNLDILMDFDASNMTLVVE